MKKYKTGIILGIISIITSLFIVGIPISLKGLPLINMIVLILALIGLLLMSLKAEDKYLLIYTTSYLVITLTLTIIIEQSEKEFILLLLGWLPSLAVALTGLVKSNQNKDIYNIKLAKILSIIGIALSLINLIGGLIVYKGFVII